MLRPPALADAPAIAAAVKASYAELHEWMDWARGAYGLREARAWCKAMEAAIAARREFPFLLTDRRNADVVGSIGLLNIDWDVPMCEIGYWVHTGRVGHGYCTEAARALTRHAFTDLNARRVQITMDDRNARSFAVAERLGFTWEATHRSNRRDNRNRLADTRVYAMLDLGQLR